MRRLLPVAALLLFAAPAQAEWFFVDVSDDEVIAYLVGTADTTGAFELQFYCDDWFVGNVELILYTAETFEPTTSYAEDGVLGVIIDGEPKAEVTAFFDSYEGEVLINTSSFEVDNLGDVVLAIAEARETIGLTYFDRSYVFPAENARSSIEQLAQNCPSQ
ncbi:hypothetical protein [Devosia faecipullorum]|uniref:hypothetical protein n=1 Tax=Devosia faecipullorum TaxID=2755039 RepID=UPI00187B1B00|nr:hypothetical protein [Devosia faecipullorum]MBE7731806.1 hypothetical protein [Devosia faecipullorum]